MPSEGPFREGMPDQHGRTLGKRTVAAVAIDAGPQEGVATEESVTIGNGLYLLGRIGGNGVSFLVDRGSWVSILAARTWRTHGGQADQILGAAVFGGRTSAGMSGQSTTDRDSRNPGRRMGLYSGGNLRR